MATFSQYTTWVDHPALRKTSQKSFIVYSQKDKFLCYVPLTKIFVAHTVQSTHVSLLLFFKIAFKLGGCARRAGKNFLHDCPHCESRSKQLLWTESLSKGMPTRPTDNRQEQWELYSAQNSGLMMCRAHEPWTRITRNSVNFQRRNSKTAAKWAYCKPFKRID